MDVFRRPKRLELDAQDVNSTSLSSQSPLTSPVNLWRLVIFPKPSCDRDGRPIRPTVLGAQVPDEYLKGSTPAMPVMTHDWAFCRWLAIEHGLVAIPTSPFFSEESRAKGLGNGLVRFCFCKTDETIEAADQVLAKMAREQHDLDGRAAVEPAVAAATAGVP